MILVFGASNYEQGTDPVLDWLIYHQAKFLKITASDLAEGHLKIDVQENEIYFKGIPLVQETQVVWYRHFFSGIPRISTEKKRFEAQLNADLRSEIRDIFEYTAYILRDKFWIPGHFSKLHPNKLRQLQLADEVGLRIPRTKILSQRNDLQTFSRKSAYGQVATKQLSERSRWYYLDKQDAYFALTKPLTEANLSELPGRFFPSMIQEYIKPELELRVLYIDGKTFSTAIVNTSKEGFADRKLIAKAGTTHFIPYQLPDRLTALCTHLMDKLELNCGSLDFILDQAGNYYFLEVNPIGQYSAESEWCNYYLEKYLAEYLIQCQERELCKCV